MGKMSFESSITQAFIRYYIYQKKRNQELLFLNALIGFEKGDLC